MFEAAPTEFIRPLDQISFGWILGIFLLAQVLSDLFRWITLWSSKRLPERYRFFLLPWPPLFRLVALNLAILFSLPLILKPETGAVATVLWMGAVVFGFAAKDYASSLMAGFFLLFERPFVVGDWVRIGGYEGEVIQIHLRTFELHTADDDRVSIPLNRIWTEPVANSTSGERIQMVVTSFFLEPENEDDPILQLLYDVVQTSVLVNLDREISVLVRERIGATEYRIKAYPREPRDRFRFETDLTVRGRKALKQIGVRWARFPAPDPASGA